MTPAVKSLERAKVAFKLHEYEHDPAADSFGQETAEKLGVDPQRIFKTLVAATDAGKLVMAIVPVSGRLNLRALAKELSVRRAEMADPARAEGATGYVVGGISPLGGRKAMPVLIDRSVMDHATIFISAGRRGMQIEIAPADLVRLIKASLAYIAAPAE